MLFYLNTRPGPHVYSLLIFNKKFFACLASHGNKGSWGSIFHVHRTSFDLPLRERPWLWAPANWHGCWCPQTTAISFTKCENSIKIFSCFLVAESYFLSWVTYYISCCCYVFRKYFQKDNKIEFFTLLLQFHFQPFGEIPAFEDGEVSLFGKFLKSKTLPWQIFNFFRIDGWKGNYAVMLTFGLIRTLRNSLEYEILIFGLFLEILMNYVVFLKYF